MRAVPLHGHGVGMDRQHTDVAQHRDDRNDQQGSADESVCALQTMHAESESTDGVRRCQRKREPVNALYSHPILHLPPTLSETTARISRGSCRSRRRTRGAAQKSSQSAPTRQPPPAHMKACRLRSLQVSSPSFELFLVDFASRIALAQDR